VDFDLFWYPDTHLFVGSGYVDWAGL